MWPLFAVSGSSFADKLEVTLRGIGRRQVREAEEQAAMINSLMRVDPGLYYGVLDQKNEGGRDRFLVGHGRGVESGATMTSRRALARRRDVKSCLSVCGCALAFVAVSGSSIYIYRV